MRFNSRNIWMSSRDYVLIIFGLCIYAFGFTAFVLPERVVIGGLVGIGSLVYFLTGIPVAITSYSLNLMLLAFAYKLVGTQFVLRTIFGATILNGLIGLMQPLFPEPLIEQQTFMNIIIGSMMCGVGIGIVFTHNGSTGGTDIVAAMVSKHTNVSIGRTMLYVDFLIVSSSYFLFHSIDNIVYGLVVTILAAFMADQVINTNRRAVQFTIISQRWEEIANAINNEAHRGCTVLNGMGWYSRHEVKVLLVMCRKIESVTIFRIVKSVDKDAFITQANVNGVYGQGFDMVKLKMKSVQHTEQSDEQKFANKQP
ncbi:MULTISPECIES: YitT family protein [Muribaculum]|uniref:YitT family protein n=1 Tax=Muribaculum caecicola TaxID=3038144 RepID=A0AC61S8B2_9BACT|nr:MULTISPECIES: YitT family protein [Muribaculum]THG55221.1 YitT family protein [Muribaculum caecicola]